MANPGEHLVDWLRDAYAMEKQAEAMLRAQASRLEDYSDVRMRIEQHLQESLGQQALLGACLTRLGTSPSLIKGMAGEMVAFGQAVSGMTMTDEVVKGAMSEYMFEHTEIAAYTALIAAAQAVGDLETRKICEQILLQEIEMGRWLLEHLPDIVSAYMSRPADARDDAKR
ncbi:ferritin-like domain-containing protein [Paraburkholderia kirstenboschensis]|uniref:Ferritin-like domain-containing protein n=1 Tax=Paraburkholderia kirstenboschensis TaxID=1245436 RepID=A0ABZ0E9R9_9BURK|nr:ferritin-like domain-containing protein [Paraburkholderia kirstenboschensis]WOD14006.1 ferritin-like domain-containing protein [Paraburkholderia kirstenboschensis]